MVKFVLATLVGHSLIIYTKLFCILTTGFTEDFLSLCYCSEVLFQQKWSPMEVLLSPRKFPNVDSFAMLNTKKLAQLSFYLNLKHFQLTLSD